MNKTIEAIFAPNGEFTIATQGFKGSTCQQATKAFENLLGEVQKRRRTSESFQIESAQHQQQIGQ